MKMYVNYENVCLYVAGLTHCHNILFSMRNVHVYIIEARGNGSRYRILVAADMRK